MFAGMKKRRVVFALNPKSWIGLLVLAIVAIPLAAVSLFFLAVLLLVLGMLMLIGVGRLLILRMRGDAPGRRDVAPRARADTFTVTPRDITEDAEARDAAGTKSDPPPPRGPLP
jgi:hypothetical protein